MKKIIILSLLCIAISSVKGMHKDINQLDSNGKTPLHYQAVFLDSIEDASSLALMDPGKAQTAAYLIMQGASVNIKNTDGKTPLYYAEKNKSALPKVYEVMQAGKIKEEYEQKYAPDAKGIYNLDHMQRVYPQEEVDAWANAMAVIAKILPTKKNS